MLTKEQIEARKLRLVELALTMTPENEALGERLEQIAICDAAIAHLKASKQEPAYYFPEHGEKDAVVTAEFWNSASDRTKEWYNKPLYAVQQEDQRESNSNPSPVHGQSKQGLTVSHTGAPTQSDAERLVDEITAYLSQLAPHQRDRKAAELLGFAAVALRAKGK
jgi:hypothetical protein